jgi:tetratricopeptide (TPR) repeat protein
LDRLDGELDNIRAALDWSRSSGQLELGLRLAVGLARFWEVRDHQREAREWLQSLVHGLSERDDLPVEVAALVARALGTTSWITFVQGDYGAARPLAEECLARWSQLGQVGNSPQALTTLAFVAGYDGDIPRQEALFRHSLALHQAEGDRAGVAWVSSWLASVRFAADDLDGAEAMLVQSLALFEVLGDASGIAFALQKIGVVATARQEYERAQTLLERSLKLYAEVVDTGSGVAYVLGSMAGLAASRGQLGQAQALCEQSVQRFRQLGELRGLAAELALLARLAVLQGDDDTAAALYAECLSLIQSRPKVELVFALEGLAEVLARLAMRRAWRHQLVCVARLLGAASALRDRLGSAASRSVTIPVASTNRDDYIHAVAATRAALGDQSFDVAWSEGRALPAEETIAEAQRSGLISQTIGNDR